MYSTHSNLDGCKEEEEVADSGQAEDLFEHTNSEGEGAAVVPRVAKNKKRKSTSTDMLLEEYLKRKESRETERDRQRAERDDIMLYLTSLAPAMRRLPKERQSWVKIKIQELLHEAEFGAVYGQQSQEFTIL